jgi:hypothetical protein
MAKDGRHEKQQQLREINAALSSISSLHSNLNNVAELLAGSSSLQRQISLIREAMRFSTTSPVSSLLRDIELLRDSAWLGVLLQAARVTTGVSVEAERLARQTLENLDRAAVVDADEVPLDVELDQAAVDGMVAEAAESFDLPKSDPELAKLLFVWWVYALVFLVTLQKVIEHPEVAGLLGAATGVNRHTLARYCMHKVAEALRNLRGRIQSLTKTRTSSAAVALSAPGSTAAVTSLDHSLGWLASP